MNEDIKYLIKNKKLITYKLNDWIGVYTKTEISEMLGISRPTLDARMKKHNWRFNEIKLILKHFS